MLVFRTGVQNILYSSTDQDCFPKLEKKVALKFSYITCHVPTISAPNAPHQPVLNTKYYFFNYKVRRQLNNGE